MDFSSILSVAENNRYEASKKSSSKLLTTKLSAPKKLERSKVNRKAVKALLQKKKEDEQKQALEAKKKKEELLKARAVAHHNRKANAMARTTKDVPKTFTIDQLEEHRQMLQEKAKAMLSKPATANSRQGKKSKDLDKGDIREQEKSKTTSKHREDSESDKQRPSSHKHKDAKQDRHDKHKNGHGNSQGKHHKSNEFSKNEKDTVSNSSKSKSSQAKVKPKRPPGPPPMNFQDLLKLASVKQHEPVKPAPPPKEKNKKEVEMRPMTQEEKDRLARTSTKEYQDWLKYGKPLPPTPQLQTSGKKSKGNDKNTSNKKDSGSPSTPVQKVDVPHSKSKPESSKQAPPKSSKSVIKEKTKTPAPPGPKKRYLPGDARYVPGMEDVPEEPPQPAKNYLPGDKRFKQGMTQQKPAGQPLPSSSNQSGHPAAQRTKKLRMPSYYQTNENVLECGPTKSASDDEEEEEETEEKPMSAWDRIYNTYHKKPVPKRPRIEEEEQQQYYEESEDDYDMDDDFIDDGPLGQNDVSKYIKEIFGYDKRKYRDDDDDVSNMEANFNDIEKEESRSLRIGMKEDLEDMKDEEARKKKRKQKQLEKLKAERMKKRY